MADQKPSEGRSPGMTLDLEDPDAVIRFLTTAKVFAGGFPVADSNSERKAALRADYVTTVDLVKLLSDIRFRCLTFVTAVIAIANALLPNNAPSGTKITFALVGFMTTLGIAVYELRNSQLYEWAIHRAKVLERELGVERISNKTHPGLFNERPPYVSDCVGSNLRPDWKTQEGERPKWMRYVFVIVKHDQGLALIYGGVLAGWFYLIVYGISSLIASQSVWSSKLLYMPGIIAGTLGLVAFIVCWRWFITHDKNRFKAKH